MNPIIQLVDLKKQFNTTWITKGVTLAIPRGKMTAIVGRSGAGKSVLLKQIAGLITPTSGEIYFDGVNITDRTPKHCPSSNPFGYVFQFAALLDSLTVFENIGLTLLEKGMPSHLVMPIVQEKLALVNLDNSILYRYPNELSGGMRKRVGLARTLISNPQVILYDEPTTGLDPITTHIIHELMADMQRKLKVTSIVISHDTEIFKYADMVALLYDGIIQWHGDAKTIWESTNPYIYQFIRGLPSGPMTL